MADFAPPQLNLPPYPFRIKLEGGKHFIFDELRKKFLVLTPEEWVRQHFIQFLILNKKYPKTLIQIEAGLKINKLQKRTDVVVFDRNAARFMLIECKAPQVKIDQSVFDQAARYNSVHQVEYLVVTNGIQHYVAKIDHITKEFNFLDDLPEFQTLL